MGTGGSWAVVLYPPSWTGGERCSARALVGHPDSPLVALQDERAALPAHLVADPAEALAREREAIRRLRERPGRPRWAHDERSAAALLIRRGDEHTAADALDPDVLRAAADGLGAEPIHLAIPSRRVLLAGIDPGVVLRACLVELARTAPADALSRLVFEVRQGALVGTSGAATARARRAGGAPAAAPGRRPTGSLCRPARPAERLGPALALGLLLVTLAGLLAAARGWGLAPPARGSVSPALHDASHSPEPPR